jgi:hypothetical protein
MLMLKKQLLNVLTLLYSSFEAKRSEQKEIYYVKTKFEMFVVVLVMMIKLN